eukprot:TRINITY_DN54183_c0_g1_i1.p1 TRINITY_DN54183_c0_g1~~TRINITY_DN54183_c0_g1_i1.p1  ORF type:complete len:269 (+),score=55.27 TRINITY_DN54183_c0_g1_i1:138-944(+)
MNLFQRIVLASTYFLIMTVTGSSEPCKEPGEAWGDTDDVPVSLLQVGSGKKVVADLATSSAQISNRASEKSRIAGESADKSEKILEKSTETVVKSEKISEKSKKTVEKSEKISENSKKTVEKSETTTRTNNTNVESNNQTKTVPEKVKAMILADAYREEIEARYHVREFKIGSLSLSQMEQGVRKVLSGDAEGLSASMLSAVCLVAGIIVLVVCIAMMNHGSDTSGSGRGSRPVNEAGEPWETADDLRAAQGDRPKRPPARKEKPACC